MDKETAGGLVILSYLAFTVYLILKEPLFLVHIIMTFMTLIAFGMNE